MTLLVIIRFYDMALSTDSRQVFSSFFSSDIHAAVNGHKLRTGEDIWAEIGILERHFNNSFPPE